MKKKREPLTARDAAATYGTRPSSKPRKKKAPAWDFWHPPTIEQLIEGQGIKPLTKESFERADFWPEGLSVEDFLAPIRRDRERSRE